MSTRAHPSVPDLPWRDLALAPRDTLVALTETPPLLLNPDVVSPVGYVEPDLEPARLRESRGGIAVCSPALGTVRLSEHGLSGRALAEVRRSAHVEVGRAVATPDRLATVLGQLALAGVPVVATPHPLPLTVAQRLGQGLSSLIRATTLSSLRTAADRAVVSVRLRRSALHSLTGLAPRLRRTDVTVVAEVRDHDGARAVLAAAAAQDVRPREVVLVCPDPMEDLPPDPTVPHRVVLGAGEEALAACAAGARGQVAELAPDLVYGPHHLSDLLLAQAYAHAEVTGVEVARRYVGELDLVAVTAGRVERDSSDLTAGTTLAPVHVWRAGRPTTGHAIHALGVAAVGGASGLSQLDGTELQEPGWASVLGDPDHPPGTERPSWARRGPRPEPLRSYFGRVGNVATSRAAASLRT